MKKIFFIIGLFVSFVASSQTWIPINQRQRFTIGLGLPVKTFTPVLGQDSAQIWINPSDSTIKFTYKGGIQTLSSGSFKASADSFFVTGFSTRGRLKQLTDSMSGTLLKYTDTSSLLGNYSRYGWVVKYTDTSSMLSNKLKYSDTAYLLSNYLRKTTLILPAEGGTGYTSLSSLAGDAAFTGAFQAKATNLTSLSALSYASTSFVKMTAAGTFALDVNTYLTTSSASSTYLPLAGGTLTGDLTVSHSGYNNISIVGTDGTHRSVLNFGSTSNSNGIYQMGKDDDGLGGLGVGSFLFGDGSSNNIFSVNTSWQMTFYHSATFLSSITGAAASFTTGAFSGNVTGGAASFSQLSTSSSSTSLIDLTLTNSGANGVRFDLSSTLSGQVQNWRLGTNFLTNTQEFGIYDVTGSVARVILAKSGSFTLGSTSGTGTGTLYAGAINGTTGTFSGELNVSAGYGLFVNGGTHYLTPSTSRGVVEIFGTTDAYVVTKGGGKIGYFGNDATNQYIYTNAANLNLYSNALLALSFNSSQAATFASSVTGGAASFTTGAFSGNVTVQIASAAITAKGAATNDPIYYDIRNSAGTERGYWGFPISATNDMYLMNEQSGTLNLGTTNGIRYTIDASGNNTWTGTGTFGSDGTFGSTNTGSTSTNFTINGGSSAIAYLKFTTGASLQSQISSYGGAMYIGTNGATTALTINSSQQATFAGLNTFNGGTQHGGQVLAFNESGVRSWSIQATGGKLNLYSGDAAGTFNFNTSVTASSFVNSTSDGQHVLKGDGSTDYFISSSFTPTIVNGAGVTSIVVSNGFYTRIGNIVTVSFAFSTGTTASGGAYVNINLPISSTFVTIEDAQGSGGANTVSPSYVCTVDSYYSSTKASIHFPQTTSSQVWTGTFMYIVH